jgi:hypothetical protein
MLAENKYVIRERSTPIIIEQKLTTTMKINSPKSEYSLKQNFFDPSKSSPPNEFIIKLHMRMNKYNIMDKKYYTDNDDNFDIK